MSTQHGGTNDSRQFPYENAVYISYERGGESEEIVDQIEQALKTRGIKSVRDKRDLGYRGSIREFMERLGRAICVIVVISDGYLRSADCMFELMEIAEAKQFRDRVFPIVLSDANIYDPVKRIEYIRYWEGKRAELAEAMRTVDPANLQGIRDDMDLYDRIRVQISGLTSILRDMNTLTPEMHKQGDYRILVDAIARKLLGWPAWLPLPGGCSVRVVVWILRVIGTVLILGLLIILGSTLWTAMTSARMLPSPTPLPTPACITPDDIRVRLQVWKEGQQLATLVPSGRISLDPDMTVELKVDFESLSGQPVPTLQCDWSNANTENVTSPTEGRLLYTTGCNVDYRSGRTKISDSLNLQVSQSFCSGLSSYVFFILSK